MATIAENDKLIDDWFTEREARTRIRDQFAAERYMEINGLTYTDQTYDLYENLPVSSTDVPQIEIPLDFND